MNERSFEFSDDSAGCARHPVEVDACATVRSSRSLGTIVSAWRDSTGEATDVEFYRAQIVRVVQETCDCKSFEFMPGSQLDNVFRPKPGQFVPVRFDIDGETHERCYAISSLVAHGQVPRITVKRVPGGLVSNYCNDKLCPGMSILVGSSAGEFRIRAGSTPIVLMAAGIGIAPMFPMLNELLVSSDREITMMIFDRNAQSVVFLEQLRTLTGRYGDRFRLRETYVGARGVASAETIVNGLVGLRRPDVYICGPAGFMDCAEKALLAAGVKRSSIFLNVRERSSDHVLLRPTAAVRD